MHAEIPRLPPQVARERPRQFATGNDPAQRCEIGLQTEMKTVLWSAVAHRCNSLETLCESSASQAWRSLIAASIHARLTGEGATLICLPQRGSAAGAVDQSSPGKAVSMATSNGQATLGSSGRPPRPTPGDERPHPPLLFRSADVAFVSMDAAAVRAGCGFALERATACMQVMRSQNRPACSSHISRQKNPGSKLPGFSIQHSSTCARRSYRHQTLTSGTSPKATPERRRQTHARQSAGSSCPPNPGRPQNSNPAAPNKPCSSAYSRSVRRRWWSGRN